MKIHVVHSLLLSAALLAATGTTYAQSQANVYFGMGTATDSSSNQLINTFGTGTTYSTPKMTGLFTDIGANLMVTPHFGIGGEFNWRNAQGAYAGLNYRPLLYDFNAIWQPMAGAKKIVPEFQAGIGGVDVRFYENSSACDQFVGCSSASAFVESANHFQTHLSAAVRFYVTPKLFVRPAFDAHWVNNLTQFGSNWIPEYTLGVGYSFGGE